MAHQRGLSLTRSPADWLRPRMWHVPASGPSSTARRLLGRPPAWSRPGRSRPPAALGRLGDRHGAAGRRPHPPAGQPLLRGRAGLRAVGAVERYRPARAARGAVCLILDARIQPGMGSSPLASSAGINERHVVGRQTPVGGDYRQVRRTGLGDEQTVERVAMMHRQGPHREAMVGIERENLDTAL